MPLAVQKDQKPSSWFRTQNPDAVRFYQRHGYTKKAVIEDTYGDEDTEFLMMKDLGKKKVSGRLLDTAFPLRDANPMKITLFVVGGLLILLGLLWVLQGFGILPGSAMSGHRRWVLIGGVVAVAGVVVGVLAARMKKK